MSQLFKFDQLCREQAELAKLAKIRDILDWDQACAMPPEGASYRGKLMSCIDEMRHRKGTSAGYEKLLEESESEVAGLPEDSWQVIQTRKSRRRYDEDKKIPAELVSELARLQPVGFGAWEKARKSGSFLDFSPVLQEVVELLQQKADILGYEHHPYNALLRNYEWGLTVEALDELFDPLKIFLKDFVRSKAQDHKDLFPKSGRKEEQERLAKKLAGQLGFRDDNGCLLTSTHPFSATLGPSDFRITTTYRDQDFLSSFFAVAHEVGHSLYEQGLPSRWWGLEVGQAASFGVHESQSLFWEHKIAGSLPFLRSWFPDFQKSFPDSLSKVSFDTFLAEQRRVSPGLIRVTADEVTYCLHIIIRYEIEKKLLNRDLKVKDIPGLWNSLYQDLLGVSPSGDLEGCLQDVHWSYGELGYFPSYALGHLMSAQFTRQLEKEVGSIEAWDGQPDFLLKVLRWLREHIHAQAALYDPLDLVRKVCGTDLSADDFQKYLRNRYQ